MATTIGAVGVAVTTMESPTRQLSTIKLLADLGRRFLEERPGATLVAILAGVHPLLAAVQRRRATLREISILTAAGATFESKILSGAEVRLDGQRTAEVLH